MSNGYPLYGLVLAGGKSTRMKRDKFSLEFHGKKQSIFCYELLFSFCEKVFISNRKEQTQLDGQKDFPQIQDTEPFLDIGPLGGILSAMSLYPNVSWLVLACDLPYINKTAIETLIDHRRPEKLATAFISNHDGLPEPLCAIYEAHGKDVLRSYWEKGIHCPRKIFMRSEVKLIVQPSPMTMDNVNNPEEYQEALRILKNSDQQ